MTNIKQLEDMTLKNEHSNHMHTTCGTQVLLLLIDIAKAAHAQTQHGRMAEQIALNEAVDEAEQEGLLGDST